MPRLGMYAALLSYTQCKLSEGFEMYIAAGFCQNLKQFLEKNA